MLDVTGLLIMVHYSPPWSLISQLPFEIPGPPASANSTFDMRGFAVIHRPRFFHDDPRPNSDEGASQRSINHPPIPITHN